MMKVGFFSGGRSMHLKLPCGTAAGNLLRLFEILDQHVKQQWIHIDIMLLLFMY